MTVERPVLRYFGGKWMLAPWILSHMPAHRIYCEPYGGGASVLMRKPRSYAEVYNDLDGDVVNVFRMIQSRGHDLEVLLRATPYARDEFNLAYEATDDPLERARRTLIRAYMGFGSNGHNSDVRTGFRASHNRQHTTGSQDWAGYPSHLKSYRERLAGVVIENRDALEVMSQQDTPETLHFVDPPYVHSTRATLNAYRFEMTDEQHGALCAHLASIEGMVMLCGYANAIYDRLGWQSVSRAGYADGALTGAPSRTEVLWLNPAAVNASAQLALFGEGG